MRNTLKKRPRTIVDGRTQWGKDIARYDKWFREFENELKEMMKTRFKNDKFYTSNLTKEERWGCQWCCNLIKEILGIA